MASFLLTLILLWPLAHAFQKITDESPIEDCRSVTVDSNQTNGSSCCKIMLDDLNSTVKDVLNYEMFKKAFTANGLPDPGKEQYAYYKLYACKHEITSLNESSMFLAPFIQGLHTKLVIKYHCTSRDNCKYKPNDASTLAPELWGWNVAAWVNPSYSTVESGRFGGMVKYLLEKKGCKRVEEVLEIYKKIRPIFGFPEESDTYGCLKENANPDNKILI